jgi:hypothetical protein
LEAREILKTAERQTTTATATTATTSNNNNNKQIGERIGSSR